ncbi:hypothetical protein OG889_40545 [Streptomyces sp. NBC_00481]|uniref:hypothetical protein n=1 Tax=unclassified Streptomyces TaxID=2593676 RepID=UPI002DD7B44B|nr:MULTISPECIES: hypothetical protein [unclassified Streptomyces]WRZ00422.1 hypothetical protein OG889_40545 [Streptomyces sp. NBC_00481]
MTTDGPGPWWSRRHSRIRAQWPTRLPGIRFCARGTLTYRAHANIEADGTAAARLALDELGRSITQNHMPEQLTTAQESLTLAAAHWHTPKDTPGLWLKAHITLLLTEQDANRAQRYQDAIREVTLQVAQDDERRERFRQAVFNSPDTTRIWWLDHHLDDLGSLDWDLYKEKILPIVGAGDDIQFKAERMAHALLYVWEKLGNDPGQHARFTTTVRTVLDQMGWNDAPSWPAPGEPPAADSPMSVSDGGEPLPVTEAGTAR